ncbi:MAG: DUF4381 family protein, partial [Clostridia bacterium]|nr:DUF4381 family protein [Deltaproteobacteria bacterium]
TPTPAPQETTAANVASSPGGSPDDVVIIATSTLWRVVWFTTSAAALIAAAVGGWILVKRRSRSTRAERRDAARRALDALNDVRDNDTPAQTSRILRELIGQRVGSTGAALSTDEAIAALEQTSSLAAAHEAESILNDCDVALYAGETDVSVKAIVGRAKDFVERLNRDA